MVIEQVHIQRLAIDKTKDDSPVSRYTHAPLPLSIACQRMQPVAGLIEVMQVARYVEVGQYATDAPDVAGIQPSGVASIMEPPQSRVLDFRSGIFVRYTPCCNPEHPANGWSYLAIALPILPILRANLNCRVEIFARSVRRNHHRVLRRRRAPAECPARIIRIAMRRRRYFPAELSPGLDRIGRQPAAEPPSCPTEPGNIESSRRRRTRRVRAPRRLHVVVVRE